MELAEGKTDEEGEEDDSLQRRKRKQDGGRRTLFAPGPPPAPSADPPTCSPAWKRDEVAEHFANSLQASLACNRQHVAVAAAAAIASATIAAGVTPTAASAAIKTETKEGHHPSVALWQLAFGKIRQRQAIADLGRSARPHTFDGSPSLPMHRHHLLPHHQYRRSDPDHDHVRRLNIEQQQHIHLPHQNEQQQNAAESEDGAQPPPLPQTPHTTNWRINSPGRGGQSTNRLGMFIGGRTDQPEEAKRRLNLLQRRGSAYDTFFEKEEKDDKEDRRPLHHHHHHHHYRQQREDEDDDRVAVHDRQREASPTSPLPKARIKSGHKYHAIIDDYPEEDDGGDYDDDDDVAFVRRSHLINSGSDVEREEEREVESEGSSMSLLPTIEEETTVTTMSMSTTMLTSFSTTPDTAGTPPALPAIRSTSKLNQSSPAPLPHHSPRRRYDGSAEPSQPLPTSSGGGESGLAESEAGSSSLSSSSSGLPNGKRLDFTSDRWQVRQSSKFPYETYSVHNPYRFDSSYAIEDRNSESSFISESDEEADEYGDIGEYGSRNYRAAFEGMPYSDPIESPSSDPLPTKAQRKPSFAGSKPSPPVTPSSPQRAADPNEAVTGDDDFRCTHRDFCQYCQQEMRGYPRNWNEEFQSLLELPVTTEKERLKRYELIHNLAQDFSITAKMYGKIIIAEAFLPRKYQTIKPCVVGGLAGGPKYIYNGIFYKFAMDDLGIYGSDENAMKAAAHDLKGLMRYSDIAGLSVPLIQLIDYRGFRLVALSILPIEQSTLAYGSADGGVVVHTDHPQLNAFMQAAGQKMNLKGHMGGSENCTEKKVIYGPTDIEGHVGLDGRLYVLDFSRVLPPTTPSKNKKNGYLYELMRPEFLKKNPKPLSSDAFSPFGVDSAAEHNAEIREATNRLLKDVIPKFASYLDEHYPNAEELGKHLSASIHKEGINIRYLGRLRYYVKSVHLKQLFLHEMIARVVKVALHRSLRKKARTLKIMSEVACKDVVVKHFNLVLGRPKQKADNFWKSAIKAEVMRKFGEQSLTPEERSEFYDLRRKVIMCHILLRIQDLCGVHLTQQAKESIQTLMGTEINSKVISGAQPYTGANLFMSSFKVVASDVDTMSVKAKKMDTVALAEANALALKAQQEVGDEAERLFKRSCNVFEQVVVSAPDNHGVQNNYADVIAQRALQKEKEKAKCTDVQKNEDGDDEDDDYDEEEPDGLRKPGVLESLQDRVNRSSDDVPRDEQDCRGQSKEACLRLFDKAVDIYAATKNLTMLEKLRTMLEKRYHAPLVYCSWEEKQHLYNIISKIWTNLMAHPLYRSAYEHYCWGKFILAHATRHSLDSKNKTVMELYKLAGSKLREALHMDPLMPWLLERRKSEESAKRTQLKTHEGMLPIYEWESAEPVQLLEVPPLSRGDSRSPSPTSSPTPPPLAAAVIGTRAADPGSPIHSSAPPPCPPATASPSPPPPLSPSSSSSSFASFSSPSPSSSSSSSSPSAPSAFLSTLAPSLNFAWERSRSSPTLLKLQQRSNSARRERGGAAKRDSLLIGDATKSGSHVSTNVTTHLKHREKERKNRTIAPRLSSLLSSTPLLLTILQEEEKEEEEEHQRAKTCLPDALFSSSATSSLASSLSSSSSSSSSRLSDSMVPLSTSSSRDGYRSVLAPPISPRRSGGGGPQMLISELMDNAGSNAGGADQQSQPQQETLFNPRDLKLMSNKDIACLVQVLSWLATSGKTERSTKRRPTTQYEDDEEDGADVDEGDELEGNARVLPRHHGKELTESERERKIGLREEQELLHSSAASPRSTQNRNDANDSADDLTLDFGRMCDVYTEAAVRALLRYYADSIVELVLPDHPHLSDLVMGDLPRYCRRLKSLTLVKCFSITKIVSLPPTLERLHLLQRHINGETLRAIGSSCQNLRVLRCEETQGMPLVMATRRQNLLDDLLTSRTTASLAQLQLTRVAPSVGLALSGIGRCISLTVLNVSLCLGLNDNILATILQGCGSTLRRLKVAGCEALTDDALVAVARLCPRLRALSASGCASLSDEGVSSVIRACPELRALNLSRCPNLRSSIGLLADHCPRLISLRLAGCVGLEAEAVERLGFAVKFGSLRTLDICGFARLSQRAVTAIAQGHPNLRRLFMRDCSVANVDSECDDKQQDDENARNAEEEMPLLEEQRKAAAVQRRRERAELGKELVRLLAKSCRYLEEFEFGWRQVEGDDEEEGRITDCGVECVDIDARKKNKVSTKGHPPVQPPKKGDNGGSRNKRWHTSTATVDTMAPASEDGADRAQLAGTGRAVVMDQLVDTNPQLRRIVLDGVSGLLDDEALELMGRRLTGLETLEIHQSVDVTARGLRQLLQTSKQLRRLVVRKCPHVSGGHHERGIELVLDAIACFGCHCLEEVDLRGSGLCHHEAPVASVAAKCYALRELAVDVGCHFVPHQTTTATATNGKGALSAAQQQQQQVESLLARSPSLTKLDIVMVPPSPSHHQARKYPLVF